MAKLPDPRSLVLNKEVKVTNGIKGHQHREKNVLPKIYFKIHEERWIESPVDIFILCNDICSRNDVGFYLRLN